MDVIDSLVQLSGTPWTYAILLAFAALDSLVPLVPSEATAIAAGVLAAAGDLNIAVVVAAAATGAFIGDSSSYVVGRTVGARAVKPLRRRARGRARLEWAERTLDERGSYLIVLARFVPGGRTAVTLTAGLTRMRGERFLRAAALAAAVWASFAVGLGYVGGRTFEEEPWQGLALAFALAASLALVVEVSRHVASTRVGRCVPCTP
jgi:membrane-associated protein